MVVIIRESAAYALALIFEPLSLMSSSVPGAAKYPISSLQRIDTFSKSDMYLWLHLIFNIRSSSLRRSPLRCQLTNVVLFLAVRTTWMDHRSLRRSSPKRPFEKFHVKFFASCSLPSS